MPEDTMIEVNAGYKLVGVMKDQPKLMCYVAGRDGDTLTVLLVNGVTTAKAEMYEREIAKVNTKSGVYNLMPCNQVYSMEDVAEVCDIIRSSEYDGL